MHLTNSAAKAAVRRPKSARRKRSYIHVQAGELECLGLGRSGHVHATPRTALARAVMGCLRNALANGGVVYLDRRGRRSRDSMNMLTFAARPAARWQDELRLLRVSVDGFEDFLAHWSRWLAASAIEAALDDRGPGWLDAVACAALSQRLAFERPRSRFRIAANELAK